MEENKNTKKLFLVCKWKKVEVSEEIYKVYWQEKNHEKYLKQVDRKNHLLFFSSFDHDGHFEDSIVDEGFDVVGYYVGDKRVLEKYPEATIVNLGCGLDETGKACDNRICHIVNIDFPDIIEIRKQLITEQDREKNIACDLKDYSWMDKIAASKGVILFAAGVFHYFKMDEVKELVLELAKRYTGGCLVFDSVGKLGLKLMMSKTLKNIGIDNVDSFFYINNPKEDLNWSENIKVSSKGYMLGYYDMKSPNIHFIHRLLAKICDNVMKMSINKMDFE